MSLRNLLRSSRAISQSCMRMEQDSFPHIALVTFLWSEGACEGGEWGEIEGRWVRDGVCIREERRDDGRGGTMEGKGWWRRGDNVKGRDNHHTPALCRSRGTQMLQSSCHTRTWTLHRHTPDPPSLAWAVSECECVSVCVCVCVCVNCVGMCSICKDFTCSKVLVFHIPFSKALNCVMRVSPPTHIMVLSKIFKQALVFPGNGEYTKHMSTGTVYLLITVWICVWNPLEITCISLDYITGLHH